MYGSEFAVVDATTQMAPVYFGMVGLLIASVVGIFAAGGIVDRAFYGIDAWRLDYPSVVPKRLRLRAV